jgi:hypothetical protein
LSAAKALVAGRGLFASGAFQRPHPFVAAGGVVPAFGVKGVLVIAGIYSRHFPPKQFTSNCKINADRVDLPKNRVAFGRSLGSDCASHLWLAL